MAQAKKEDTTTLLEKHYAEISCIFLLNFDFVAVINKSRHVTLANIPILVSTSMHKDLILGYNLKMFL